MGLKHGILQSLEDSSEEAPHDQLSRLLGSDTASHHVEEFVFVEFAGGRAVGASHVVGQDLKAGHGVGLGLVAEHEVAHLLVRIGLMGGFLDLDEARKDRLRGIGQGIVVEQIARGTR